MNEVATWLNLHLISMTFFSFLNLFVFQGAIRIKIFEFFFCNHSLFSGIVDNVTIQFGFEEPRLEMEIENSHFFRIWSNFRFSFWVYVNLGQFFIVVTSFDFENEKKKYPKIQNDCARVWLRFFRNTFDFFFFFWYREGERNSNRFTVHNLG